MPDDQDTLIQRRPKLTTSQSARRQPALVMLLGPQVGRVYRLKPGRHTIGRSYSREITVDEDGVSRTHAILAVDDEGGVSVADAGSTNGTTLNRELLTRFPRQLKDGDRVSLGGSVTFKFVWLDALEEKITVELYDSAVRDPLTGAWNRRYLDVQLHAELGAARRRGLELSMLALDLDHFKQVNDLHGHAIGDQTLRAVSEALLSACGEAATVARVGGEEFAVLLPGQDLSQATALAERIRAAVSAIEIPTERGPVRVTVSLGVASLAPEMSAQGLYTLADARLYQAKAEGRDRVIGG
jgi:two-component system cell cycle response regulator